PGRIRIRVQSERTPLVILKRECVLAVPCDRTRVQRVCLGPRSLAAFASDAPEPPAGSAISSIPQLAHGRERLAAAREATIGNLRPLVLGPGVGEDPNRAFVDLEEVEPARLASPLGPRLTQP